MFLQSKPIANFGSMILYRVYGPWKLLDDEIGVSSDGWMETMAAWTYFPKHSGFVTIDLRRTAFNGVAPFAHATIIVGTVKLDDNQEPVMRHVFAVRHAIVRNGPNSDVRVRVYVARSPVRVVVTIPQSDTFQAEASDPRHLGAQIEFRFKPTKLKS